MTNKQYVALALLGTLSAPAPLADEFRIGAQAGLPGWSFDVSVPLLVQSTSVEPDAEPSFGVVGQYIMRSGDGDAGDFFVGVEASYGAESVSGVDRLTLLGTAVDVVAETSWVTDVSWLAGFNLAETPILGNIGDVTVFGSVGATYAKGVIGVTLPDLGLSGSDEGKHFGLKVGAGVEFDVGTSTTLQVRANYAYYEGRAYRDQGVSLDVEPGAFEIRATLLYKFDYCALLGC
ncbi:MAG: outer membrane beta-barrel protein [Gammaproteobacteria bacterium]|nr:outer membrane beta-barrel protein [Gammaproteobacteria bacterium]MDE0444442.1 outer membrane beta-barrel protein [Gammaproteobacteria bacterium]